MNPHVDNFVAAYVFLCRKYKLVMGYDSNSISKKVMKLQDEDYSMLRDMEDGRYVYVTNDNTDMAE